MQWSTQPKRRVCVTDLPGISSYIVRLQLSIPWPPSNLPFRALGAECGPSDREDASGRPLGRVTSSSRPSARSTSHLCPDLREPSSPANAGHVRHRASAQTSSSQASTRLGGLLIPLALIYQYGIPLYVGRACTHP